MSIDLGVVLTGLLVVGFLAQWLAWRMRLPAILFLLLIGIVLGPASGFFKPDRALGGFLFPSVSLAVALILFEGSLTLRFSELRGIGHAVRGMVSYGAVLALLMLAAAAHWIAGVRWEVAFLFGALTCVTGPTVITPMLRTLRPTARIASALRWEGIVLDPLGALFAVLVFEAIITHQQGHSLAIFAETIGIGAGIGLVVAWGLGFLLRRQMIPEYLQAYGTLIAVLGAFTLANQFAHESGLVAVTIMGITLGNLRRVHIENIMDFKEHLSTVLVSMLFVILAARLQWPLPPGMLMAGILVFVAAQFVIRPVSILVATFGSQLDWRERALLSYVSPRGVVAASVSSLFALRLEDLGVTGAGALVPLVFILIIATVVLQSATARPLAYWLGVAAPDPTGVLIYGSDEVARSVGKALAEQQFQVVLADDDWGGISAARMAGLTTFYGNPTSQHAAMHLDLTGIGRLLAMSWRREMNSLACMHFRQEFGRERVYRLRVLAPEESGNRAAFAGSLSAKALFGDDMTHTRFRDLLEAGWRIKANALTNTFDWPAFVAQHGADTVLLFGIEPGGKLRVASNRRKTEPRSGWTVIALVPPAASGTTPAATAAAA
ncbi:MAG TPA: sodium:proton antiporter [Rhodanobacteraceae bacterium]|jgi:NhaP-type Na+/H+ or K+/H+ antiporter|nr:sodium:proton antiporter [Rhodanobacteraceae bacterium]